MTFTPVCREPMAARVHPQNVRSAHQSMHHLVADADWSDQGLLAAVTAQVPPVGPLRGLSTLSECFLQPLARQSN